MALSCCVELQWSAEQDISRHQPARDGRDSPLNYDTADLYRYFDSTEAAESLYACVERTADKDLPEEIDFLSRNDEAKRRIMDSIELPHQMVENLIRFIRLNEGELERKRREGEFAPLTDEEVRNIEAIVKAAFAGFGESD